MSRNKKPKSQEVSNFTSLKRQMLSQSIQILGQGDEIKCLNMGVLGYNNEEKVVILKKLSHIETIKC